MTKSLHVATHVVAPRASGTNITVKSVLRIDSLRKFNTTVGLSRRALLTQRRLSSDIF